MPGLSFLFKKRFHPSRLDNQKKVFLTEENKKKESEKEKELAVLVAKERELQMYEGLGKGPELDPRNASLKFMYHAPAAKGKKEKDSHLKTDGTTKEEAPPLDSNGDDEHVRAFRAKFLGASNHSSSVPQANDQELIIGPAPPPPPADVDGVDSDDSDDLEKDLNLRKFPTQSTLERATGKKQRAVVSAEEQGERHPALKNAPVDGVYAQQTAVRHKPFNTVIRNVRCLRCGLWGHYSGDRECLLREHNPLDYERLMREDPMAHSLQQEPESQPPSQSAHSTYKSKKITAQTAREYFRGNDDADYESSDPEGEFLRSLTRREKKLLLWKLQGLDQKKNDSGLPDDSDSENSRSSGSSSNSTSTSSNSSGGSTSSSSNHGGKTRRKRKHTSRRHSKEKKKRRKSSE